MYSIVLLALIAFVAALNDIGSGTMSVYQVGGVLAKMNSVIISRGHLSIGLKPQIFDYYSAGGIVSLLTGYFLKVDEKGKIVLSDTMSHGFAVSEKDPDSGHRFLSYNGTNVFQLCSDASVAYMSDCNVIYNATIVYEDA